MLFNRDIYNHIFLTMNSQKRVALCVVAMALGGCMASTIYTYVNIKYNNYDGFNPIESYNKVALTGEVFSVLCLVS